MLTITGNLNPSQLSSELGKNLLANLKTGQIINAEIQQLKGDQVSLKVGPNILTARTQELNLPTGQVQLSVKQTQPSLVLALLSKPLSGEQPPILNTALRQHLANQIPLAQGTQQLTQLLNQLPSSLQAPLTALLDNLRKPLGLDSGKTLKQQLENSGVFLENKLSRPNLPDNKIHSDLKAQLLQFKQLSQSLQSSQNSSASSAVQLAAKLSDQMISRITFHQLQLYDNPAITLLDLPSNHSHALEDQLEFRKQQMQQGSRWEAYINVHTELGEIKSKLTYSAQQSEQLFCGIWCENQILEERLQHELATLKAQLQTLEIDTLRLELLKQPPQQSKQSQRIALVDIHI